MKRQIDAEIQKKNYEKELLKDIAVFLLMPCS